MFLVRNVAQVIISLSQSDDLDVEFCVLFVLNAPSERIIGGMSVRPLITSSNVQKGFNLNFVLELYLHLTRFLTILVLVRICQM